MSRASTRCALPSGNDFQICEDKVTPISTSCAADVADLGTCEAEVKAYEACRNPVVDAGTGTECPDSSVYVDEWGVAMGYGNATTCTSGPSACTASQCCYTPSAGESGPALCVFR